MENSESSNLVCPVCHASKTNQIIPAHKRFIFRCLNCGLYFYYPPLTEEENNSIYTENYLDHKMLDKGLRESRRVIYEFELSYIEKILPSKTANILDIGCSDGSFLRLLKKRGYQNLSGVEIVKPDAEAAKTEFGGNIHNKKLRECSFPDESFDMITLWDVIDLMLNPLEEIKEINRILKETGIIIIRTRNMTANMPCLRLNRLFKFLRLPTSPGLMHMFGFNRRSLQNILVSNGFEIIKTANSRLSKGTPYGSKNVFYSISVSAAKIIIEHIARLTGLITANRLLISPSIIAYARKYGDTILNC